MKSLIFIASVFVSAQVFAATVELGKYLAVPKDFPDVKANLELFVGNEAAVRIDAEGTIINCTGTFVVEENNLNAHALCDHPAAPEINVSIDITNVTPEGLRSEAGVEVPVKFDLLGEDPVQFILKKND